MRFMYSAAAAETDDCIEWPYRLCASGYPTLHVDDLQYIRPGRIICELAYGPLDRAKLGWKCGNKTCVNVRHLEWVKPVCDTPTLETIQREFHAGATAASLAVKYGLTEPQVFSAGKARLVDPTIKKKKWARLSLKDASQIRRLFARGWTKARIAAKYGISHPEVTDIIKYKYWRPKDYRPPADD